MKFMIITTNGTYFTESEDFESVANEIYDNHTGYDNIVGIIKIDGE